LGGILFGFKRPLKEFGRKVLWMGWVFETFLTLQQILTMNKMNLGFLQDGDIRNVAYMHSLVPF
jgi:hypothetical protein